MKAYLVAWTKMPSEATIVFAPTAGEAKYRFLRMVSDMCRAMKITELTARRMPEQDTP